MFPSDQRNLLLLINDRHTNNCVLLDQRKSLLHFKEFCLIELLISQFLCVYRLIKPSLKIFFHMLLNKGAFT
jgi:hypothetical protein